MLSCKPYFAGCCHKLSILFCVVYVQAAKEILRADDDTVSSLLAGLTLGTGVIGTLGGGTCHSLRVKRPDLPHCRTLLNQEVLAPLPDAAPSVNPSSGY